MDLEYEISINSSGHFNTCIDDGIFPLPLFHGTSDIFGVLIMKTGLGAENIIERYKIIELAREVFSLLQKCNPVIGINGWDYEDEIYALELMCRQEVTNGNFNYRHGTAYLTAEKARAESYASNKKGSEILTKIYTTSNLIPVDKLTELSKIFKKYPEGKNLIDANHHPIIVTANDVPIESLCGEQGGDILKEIEQIKIMEEIALHLAIQSCRFELIAPVLPSSLTIEYINDC